MGLLGKVKALETTGPVGLLRRSQMALRHVSDSSAAGVDTADSAENGRTTEKKRASDLQATLRRIAALAHGVDAPAHLFRLIQEYIGFRRGALFLAEDQSRVWLPVGWRWAAEVPFDRISSLIPELDLQSSRLTVSQKLSELLAGGTHEQPTAVVLKAFYHEERLIGLLVVESTGDDAMGEVKAVINPSAHRIVRRQYEYLAGFPEDVLKDRASLEEALSSSAEKPGASLPVPVIVFFGSLVQSVAEQIGCISSIWLHRILSYMLAGLFSGIGTAYEGTNDHVVVLVPQDIEFDQRLAAHQCALSLRYQFQIPFEPDHIRFRTVSAEDILRTEDSRAEK